MQSRLPDVNTAFNMYRGKAMTSWQIKNYSAAIGSLYAFNGLLPEEYRIKISTTTYNEKTKREITIQCLHCEREHNYESIKIMKIHNLSIDKLLSEREFEKIWICPGCSRKNKLFASKMVRKKPAEPHFLKVIPNPPERKDGLIDRTNYHNKFSIWFWSFLDELESAAAQFRENYKPIGGNINDEDNEIETAGEETE